VDRANIDIHKIRAAIFQRKVAVERSLMAKGIYLSAQMESEKVLNSRRWRYHQSEYNFLKYGLQILRLFWF